MSNVKNKNKKLNNRKMQNKRFRHTEQAIYIAYFHSHGSPSVNDITRRAKISRATLYRHHKTVHDIPKDCEEYLLEKYLNKKCPTYSAGVNLRTVFLHILIFIINYDRMFKALFENDRKKIIKTIFNQLEPIIIAKWQLVGNPEKLYYIYKNEVISILEFWGKRDFSNQFLSEILSDIMFLTETAPRRLSSIVD